MHLFTLSRIFLERCCSHPAIARTLFFTNQVTRLTKKCVQHEASILTIGAAERQLNSISLLTRNGQRLIGPFSLRHGLSSIRINSTLYLRAEVWACVATG